MNEGGEEVLRKRALSLIRKGKAECLFIESGGGKSKKGSKDDEDAIYDTIEDDYPDDDPNDDNDPEIDIDDEDEDDDD